MLNPGQEQKYLFKEPFLYCGQVALVANSAGQIIFQVAANFTFNMTRLSYTSATNSANSTATFDIQLLRNETTIFSDFVPNQVLAGMMLEISPALDLRYPVGLANWFKFDCPLVFPAKSTIVVNLRDTSGQANTVRIAIAGFKHVLSYN